MRFRKQGPIQQQLRFLQRQFLQDRDLPLSNSRNAGGSVGVADPVDLEINDRWESLSQLAGKIIDVSS